MIHHHLYPQAVCAGLLVWVELSNGLSLSPQDKSSAGHQNVLCYSPGRAPHIGLITRNSLDPLIFRHWRYLNYRIFLLVDKPCPQSPITKSWNTNTRELGLSQESHDTRSLGLIPVDHPANHIDQVESEIKDMISWESQGALNSKRRRDSNRVAQFHRTLRYSMGDGLYNHPAKAFWK